MHEVTLDTKVQTLCYHPPTFGIRKMAGRGESLLNSLRFQTPCALSHVVEMVRTATAMLIIFKRLAFVPASSGGAPASICTCQTSPMSSESEIQKLKNMDRLQVGHWMC
jgi:hypothetical protein